MQDEEQRKIEELLAKLLREPRRRFPGRRERLEASNRKGVYVIYGPQGKVVHVGSTPRAKEGVAQRLRDHLNGNSSFTYTKFGGDGSRLRDGYEFQYLIVDNGRDRALLEALGIGRLCPEHIGHGLDGPGPYER
jgi:hypothetical protein